MSLLYYLFFYSFYSTVILSKERNAEYIRTVKFFRKMITFCYNNVACSLKEKWSHFDLKSWVTGGTKIHVNSSIPSNWRIFESKSLSLSSHFDFNILQLLRIPGRILYSSTLFRSKWLHFFFQCLFHLTFIDKLDYHLLGN